MCKNIPEDKKVCWKAKKEMVRYHVRGCIKIAKEKDTWKMVPKEARVLASGERERERERDPEGDERLCQVSYFMCNRNYAVDTENCDKD